MEGSFQLHAPAALTLVPIRQEAGWDTRACVGKRGLREKNPCLCWESNPGRLVRSLVTILIELSRP